LYTTIDIDIDIDYETITCVTSSILKVAASGKTEINMGEYKSVKGLKQSLPNKPCVQCKKPMQWRKKWAKNWSEVKFCSQKCKSEYKKKCI
jgi:hypothetical protein